MRRLGRKVFAFAGAAMLIAAPGESQPVGGETPPTYADLADLTLKAPVAAHVRLRSASALKPGEAGIVPAGRSRFYVEADVLSLLRAPQGLPARVSYLADFPSDAKGKPVKPRKGSEFLLLAEIVPGRTGELKLVTPGAQLTYVPGQADLIRSILREATSPQAPPRITGVARAFHVPGSLPGESETQIFLNTAENRPVSLTVLRRPGEEPRWAVALTEIVDDAAAPPQPNSLLWYRLACFLPRGLPRQTLAGAEALQARAMEADYRLVMERLGPCVRSRR